MTAEATGRILHARLHLLDRQVVSAGPSRRMLCKVDDLEIEHTDEGVPYVSALLSGPAALGPRLPGLLGFMVRSVHARLHPDRDPRPNRIPAARIRRVAAAVEVDDADGGVDVEGFGQWVAEHVISRLPGAHHEAE